MLQRSLARIEMDRRASNAIERARMLRLQNERDALERHYCRLQEAIETARAERRSWEERTAAVSAFHTQESAAWAAFKARMAATLKGQSTMTSVTLAEIHDNEKTIEMTLKPQQALWASKVRDAKSEIHETKAILLDMEKKKRVLSAQLQQAQALYNELRAREDNARATHEVHALRLEMHHTQAPLF
ncbi:hypothetical protein ACHHYP_11361 [Achlya hypogyna]|uniref:Uncharacterized protein n=1 Tax=Achlya hypogyna TaxID=1202772 RepID=A0A1V9YJ96_ACHHY|nr:hypothetical protein ACHHYP_11361 [Achlya hypogyna]